MGKELLPDAGYFVLPRQWGLNAVWGFILLVAAGGMSAGALYMRMDALSEKYVANRADINRLLSERDEMIRMRSELSQQGALLREIRDELKRR